MIFQSKKDFSRIHPKFLQEQKEYFQMNSGDSAFFMVLDLAWRCDDIFKAILKFRIMVSQHQKRFLFFYARYIESIRFKKKMFNHVLI